MTIQETQTLKGQQLNAVATETPTAHEVALDLAARQRLRHYSDVTRTRIKLVREGKQIVEKDYMAFWQGLEKLSIGTLIYPRKKSNPVRFEWHYSLKSVAKAMVEGTDEVASKVEMPKKKITGRVLREISRKELEQKNGPFSGIAKSLATKIATHKDAVAIQTKRRPGRPRLKAVEGPAKLKVLVLLRAGRQAQLEIPSDFSEQEANKICAALKKASA